MNNTFHVKTHPVPLFLATTFAVLMLTSSGCSKLDELAALPPPGTSVGTPMGDKAVANQVKASLLGNAALRGIDIAVSAVNGDVRLSGLVDTQAQIDQAIKLARSVEGVHTIHDELRIARPGEMAVPTGIALHTQALGELDDLA